MGDHNNDYDLEILDSLKKKFDKEMSQILLLNLDQSNKNEKIIKEMFDYIDNLEDTNQNNNKKSFEIEKLSKINFFYIT